MSDNHQESTGDGEVLQQHDSLYLIRQIPVEQECRQLAESRQQKRCLSRHPAQYHGLGAKNFQQNTRVDQDAWYAHSLNLLLGSFLSDYLLNSGYQENQT
jgi:hypothetical protein